MSALCSLQLRRLEAENHRLESELLASRRSAAVHRLRMRFVGWVRTVTSCRCGPQSTACSTRCAAASTHGRGICLGVRHLLWLTVAELSVRRGRAMPHSRWMFRICKSGCSRWRRSDATAAPPSNSLCVQHDAWQLHRSSRRSLQERDALKDKYMRFSAGASLHIVTPLSLRGFAVAYDRVRSQLMAATALRPGWCVLSML
jgi:hypothetical protein